MEGRGAGAHRDWHRRGEGSARNPPKGCGANTVIYVVAKATTHEEFQRQGQNPNPSHTEGFGTPRVSVVLRAKYGAARISRPPAGVARISQPRVIDQESALIGEVILNEVF
jgi:hypothetical protein